MDSPAEPLDIHALQTWAALPYDVHVSPEITAWMRDQIAALVAEVERFRKVCPHDENDIEYDEPVEFTCTMCGGQVEGVRRPCTWYDADWWDDEVGVTVDGARV